jgi:hypothetical protein
MSAAPIDPDQHPFITARHVDNLTEAIRSLDRHIAAGAHNHREHMDAMRAQSEILRDLRKTADMMLEIMVRATSNGSGALP